MPGSRAQQSGLGHQLPGWRRGALLREGVARMSAGSVSTASLPGKVL
jgi:hypothetical protein